MSQESDVRDFCMLCTRGKRPSRRTAEQRDELAAFHRPTPPVLSTKDSTPQIRRETAALQDVHSPYGRFGSMLSKKRVEEPNEQ
jgi:hypothetical protein